MSSFLPFIWKDLNEEKRKSFGQSCTDELRWKREFSTLRKQEICWHKPTPDENIYYDAHPELGRFGDWTYAVAAFDGRKLIVRERLWNGFPDPPEFVLFVLSAEGKLWCAQDFDWWPKAWKLV